MPWAPDYSDATSVRNYIRAGLDSDQDAFIAQWITATSRNVDDFTGRQFGNTGTAQARTYYGTWDRALRQWIYEIDDVQNATGLTVTLNGTVQGASAYELWPLNALSKGKPYTQLRMSTGGSGTVTPFPPTTTLRSKVDVSAIFGWTAVPAAIPTAMLLQAARLAKRRDSPFGVAGSPQQGSELRLLAQLDPDFRTTLKPYVRDWWAA